MLEPVLSVKRLTKVYGSKYAQAEAKALNGIDLTVNRGEYVSIMGPSGSGKTTLLNLLAGLDKPTAGSLLIGNEDIAKFSQDKMSLFRRRNLGFIFQDFNLLDSLTVAENVALPLVLDGKKGASVRSRVEQVLQWLGMVPYQDRYPYELSGGQQQRVAVARAVVHEPALVLADEPTGNLDSKSSKSLLEVFEQLNRDHESTILMVTHDPFAASYSHRIVFIKDGIIFSQLHRPGSRQDFFHEIMNTLSVLEGSVHDMA